jgi:hypothetical protein
MIFLRAPMEMILVWRRLSKNPPDPPFAKGGKEGFQWLKENKNTPCYRTLVESFLEALPLWKRGNKGDFFEVCHFGFLSGHKLP